MRGAERFVVIAGDVGVLEDAEDVVIDRLDPVLLLRTTPERSRELSSRPSIVVSVYESEALARSAFEAFRDSSLVRRPPTA
jgi:hypothetical protein